VDALVSLCPFGKKNTTAILTGITNDSQDISVDLVRTVTIPLMKKFGIGEEDGLELKVTPSGCYAYCLDTKTRSATRRRRANFNENSDRKTIEASRAH
jgi:hypothetical protein